MEPRCDPAYDVIQELPSFIASISSVANEGRGRSSLVAGGHGAFGSFKAERFRRIMTSVPTRKLKAAVFKSATAVEYDTMPMNRLGIPTPLIMPATTVEDVTMAVTGSQMIHWFHPNEMGLPIRTWMRVTAAITSRQDCLVVNASQSLTDDPMLLASSNPDDPPTNSHNASQTKSDRAKRSTAASHMCALSAKEIDLKVGRPNSFCMRDGVSAAHYPCTRGIRTGETRLLRGWGGRMGMIIRRMTKAEAKSEKKARASVGRSGIIAMFDKWILTVLRSLRIVK